MEGCNAVLPGRCLRQSPQVSACGLTLATVSSRITPFGVVQMGCDSVIEVDREIENAKNQEQFRRCKAFQKDR